MQTTQSDLAENKPGDLLVLPHFPFVLWCSTKTSHWPNRNKSVRETIDPFRVDLPLRESTETAREKLGQHTGRYSVQFQMLLEAERTLEEIILQWSALTPSRCSHNSLTRTNPMSYSTERTLECHPAMCPGRKKHGYLWTVLIVATKSKWIFRLNTKKITESK